MKYFISFLFSSFLFLVCGYALAAPEIKSIDTGGNKDITSGLTISVSGLNFGNKTQAQPVLYDLTSFAYENGVKNLHQSTFSDGQNIERLSLDPATLWSKPSAKTTGGGEYVKYSTGRSARTSNLDAHYYFTGSNGFLGWPMAYGGETTPVDNSYLYVSWWVKNKIDSRYYWRFNTDSITGTFDTGDSNFELGERVTIGDNFTGNVIAVISNEIHFVVDKPLFTLSSTTLKGLNIIGVTSKAVAKLVSTGSEGTAYLTPGANKFLRSWEEVSGSTGWRYSFNQMLTGVTGTVGEAINSTVSRPLITDEWNHIEVQIDLNKKITKSWVNNILVDELDVANARILDGNYSPTIALIGFNGKNQIFQTTDFGEIYMDKSLQRIVIADNSEWDNVTLSEIQYPTSWSDTSIKFESNVGNFQPLEKIYLYIFDGSGIVNSQGFPLCLSCKSLPMAPVLTAD